MIHLSICQNAFLDSLPNGLNFLILHPVNFDNLPPDTKLKPESALWYAVS
ncbi:hypothetical protein HanXRQr2_Chr05g0212451 [Helianthus annuus]|uniref:Uncharacterized protein n=1 Tax=Helianthus annuus TaxID=4232 RepID=A0A9K3IZN6_HELAN|nr:hypothetical protein HanXRQr2_Chr05g0212451 [Helianthus annuus]